MTLNSGIQTYQILTNDDEVCIPSLFSILLAVPPSTFGQFQRNLDNSREIWTILINFWNRLDQKICEPNYRQTFQDIGQPQKDMLATAYNWPQFYIQLVFKAPLCITLTISDQNHYLTQKDIFSKVFLNSFCLYAM